MVCISSSYSPEDSSNDLSSRSKPNGIMKEFVTDQEKSVAANYKVLDIRKPTGTPTKSSYHLTSSTTTSYASENTITTLSPTTIATHDLTTMSGSLIETTETASNTPGGRITDSNTPSSVKSHLSNAGTHVSDDSFMGVICRDGPTAKLAPLDGSSEEHFSSPERIVSDMYLTDSSFTTDFGFGGTPCVTAADLLSSFEPLPLDFLSDVSPGSTQDILARTISRDSNSASSSPSASSAPRVPTLQRKRPFMDEKERLSEKPMKSITSSPLVCAYGYMYVSRNGYECLHIISS